MGRRDYSNVVGKIRMKCKGCDGYLWLCNSNCIDPENHVEKSDCKNPANCPLCICIGCEGVISNKFAQLQLGRICVECIKKVKEND